MYCVSSHTLTPATPPLSLSTTAAATAAALVAAQDVADAVSALDGSRRQTTALDAATDAARNANRMARQRYEALFTGRRMAQAYLDIYQRLAPGRAPAPAPLARDAVTA
mgnify:CR=1 FL=1